MGTPADHISKQNKLSDFKPIMDSMFEGAADLVESQSVSVMVGLCSQAQAQRFPSVCPFTDRQLTIIATLETESAQRTIQ